MNRQSWKPDVFDRLYAADPDPWKFESSPYEQAKYADTLAQLDGRRFLRGLELGCSIGVLSALLAPHCDALLALDAAAAAIEQARRRCAHLDHLVFRQAILPTDWPEGGFDLILISELLYFLSPDDIARTARLAAASARPDALILLVNWTGDTDTPTTGHEAASLFRREAGFVAEPALCRQNYRLDRLWAVGSCR